MGSVLSLTLLSCLCLTACDGSLEMRVVADWRIEIGSGTVGGITLSEPVTFDITPPQRIAIHDERHAAVALFNPDAGGWGKGVRLHAVQTAECSATDRFYPETLQVKSAAGEEAVQFVYGRDYEIDSQWGSFGRIKGSAIGENQEVFIDYDYEQDRLDTLAVNASGEVFLFAGIPSLGVVLPGAETAGFVPVARVWIPGRGKKLTKDNLYPISFEGWDGQSDSLCAAEESLPKTLEKLRTGIPLTLVTFGDSVSCGGGVGSDQSLWWQSQFMTRLKEQFPISQVTWKNAGWGGASSSAYMQSPAGSEHDYVRDVLAPKPDLVIIEFVNDAYLDEKGVTLQYGKILADLRGVGAEVILMTPHLVRPDWMGLETMRVKTDPRSYVRGLKAFGAENNVAVADASLLYCNLWKRGIPYMTLMTNSINHPDMRGHKLFADALLALFPTS